MADVALLEEFDNFAGTRNALRVMAEHVGEFAGLPIGIEGEELVIDPSYPWAAVFNKPAEPEPGVKVRNRWYSQKHRCYVTVAEIDGEICAVPELRKKIDLEIGTLGCSFAWGIEQEHNALQLLGTLVRHHTFKQYLLTGMFLETSQRSGVIYLFRKLRPTVALKEHKGMLRLLCAMCMHPIGYYAGSWAGAMCPTDDVIAHLMLMRGDEKMFWRRCNQHPANAPEAGL